MRGRNSPVPVIVRDFCSDDRLEPIAEVYNSVTRVRGLGPSGYKLQRVEKECPCCGNMNMVRRVDVNPEHPNEVRYWCENPWCTYWVGDQFSYTKRHPTAPDPEPEVYGYGD